VVPKLSSAPKASEPTTAPGMLPRPPRITTMKALMTTGPPTAGVSTWIGSRRPAAAAACSTW